MATAQMALLPPSTVVTVIVQLPPLAAVTKPLADTFAFVASEVDQVTAWFVAFEGLTVAVSWLAPAIGRETLFLSRVTPLTDTTAAETVTEQLALLSPSAVVTVIVALPMATPLTRPFEETVALLEPEVDQLTLLFVASAGTTVATS